MTKRFIPDGGQAIRAKFSNSVVYVYDDALGRPCAIGYTANATKATFNYGFVEASQSESADQRAVFVADWLKGKDLQAKARADRAAEQKAALAEPHYLKVGSVLCATSGLENERVFYQVTAVVEKRRVFIRSIRKITFEDPNSHLYESYCIPDIDNFTGEPSLKRVCWRGDSVYISRYTGSASLITRD